MNQYFTFNSECTNVVKVITIDVSVYPEQPAHYRFHGVSKVLWEWNAWRVNRRTERVDPMTRVD